MILRDALDIRRGTAQRNKIYKGTYKVWDRNKIALEGYCKQNTTEGINLIEPKIATGTTKNGITITNNGDGSYIINGTATTGTDIRLDQSIPAGTDNLKNYTAGTYSLSCNELKTGLRLVLMQNQTWAKLIEMQYTNTPITKYIEDTNNVFFYLYIDGGTTYNNYMLRPQLEKSPTVHDWEPYTGGQPSPSPDYEQPIEVMQGRQVVTVKGTDYTVDLKSKNELNYDLEPENKYYDMNGQPVTISGAVYVNQIINLLANTTYTFSYEEKIGDATVRLCEYKEDGTFIKRTLIQNNNVSIKLNSETSYVITSTNKAPTSMFIKPQLEEGLEATDYEPYYDYKLAGIGDYKDNFYTDKGKWYFKQNIGNVVLDGSENWEGGQTGTVSTDYTYVYTNAIDSLIKILYYGAFCDRFKNLNADMLISTNVTTDTISVGSSARRKIRIMIKSSRLSAQSVSGFKTWLSTHNTEVYYRLANAIITEIPSTYTTLINQLNALYQAM